MNAMTRIPVTAVRLSYLWPCNLAQAAWLLRDTYAAPMSPAQLDLLWDAECVNHPLLHELGERPEIGFEQTRADVALARQLLAKDHDTNGGAKARLSMEVKAEKVA